MQRRDASRRDLARGAGIEHLLRAAALIYAYPSEESLVSGTRNWSWRRPHGVEFRIVRGDELRELEPALSPHIPAAVVVDDCGHTTDPSRLAFGGRTREWTRERIKLLARKAAPDELLTCPTCDRQVKARNLVRHFDRNHL